MDITINKSIKSKEYTEKKLFELLFKLNLLKFKKIVSNELTYLLKLSEKYSIERSIKLLDEIENTGELFKIFKYFIVSIVNFNNINSENSKFHQSKYDVDLYFNQLMIEINKKTNNIQI
jgi:hypothetical protein